MSLVVQLLHNLVAINSVSSTLSAGPGEAEIASWIYWWLEARDIACWLLEAEPGRPNLVARIAGRGTGAPLLLNAHLDTVDVAGIEAPFSLRTEGDRLYGRGAYDMKGSAAIMLALAEQLHDEPPPGDLWLTFSSDEEDLSRGTEALIRDWLPTLEAAPAAAVVLEPTEEAIGIAHKGFAWFEMTVTGRAGHGSRPAEAIDAIAPLGRALAELESMEREFIERARHPLLGRPSLHASTISGGSTWSVYP
ncbi:MAG: M20/M25/M40 family metallo-hydrolase, partial [Ardenticatenaceae bacterium]